MELYNYYFRFKDSEGNYYSLRHEQLVAASVRYRAYGSHESFTETGDFNVDEGKDALWVRLPALGKTEIGINVTVEPLRNICTPLTVIDLGPFTAEFVMSATPTPIESLQGFSPRVIDGYWHEFDDETQTFRNTYIKAEATIIKEGEVVDYPEQGNQNPITSNAVWNVVNNQNNINNQVNNHFTNIENRLDEIDGKPDVSVILNGVEHTQNINGQIDLGEIDTAPNTHMLSMLTEINGTYYPKGTEVDDDNKVYATDGFYYDYCDTKQMDGKSHLSLFSLRPGWYRIQYQVYTTTVAGDIYVSKQGERGWSVITTSKQVADTFSLYYSSTVSSPNLIVSASSGYYIGRFSLMTDQNIRINKWPMNLDKSDLQKMKYFLVDYEYDTITIESNNYKMNDLTITHFIVDVDGAVSVEVPDSGIGNANDFSFTATHDDTKIIFNDGTQTIESDFFDTGTRAELIYVSPEEFYWNYYEDSSLNVKDVKVDGSTVVANRIAYIYSFTKTEVDSIKDLFT